MLAHHEVKGGIPDAVGKTEMGNGVRGGVEALPNIVRAYMNLDAGSDTIVIKTDIANAFNSVCRGDVLKCAETFPQLKPLIMMIYGAPTHVSYAKGKHAAPLLIEMERGVNQGDPMAPLLYTMVVKPAIDATLAQHPTVTFVGVADDKYIMGKGLDALAAFDTYKVELAKRMLCLQPEKSKAILARPDATSDSARAVKEECARRGIEVAEGISVAGCPVGSAKFVNDTLNAATDEYLEHMNKVTLVAATCQRARAAGAARLHAQQLYKLVRWCLAPAMINYLLRTLPDAVTRPHAMRYDEGVFQTLTAVLNIAPGDAHGDSTTPEGNLVKDRAHLRARDGGLGIISAAQTAPDARLGNLLLTAHLVANALKSEGAGWRHAAPNAPEANDNDFTPDAAYFPVAGDFAVAEGTQGERALPELYHYTQSDDIKGLAIEELAGRDASGLFEGYMLHMSSKLGEKRAEARLTAILNRLAGPDEKAWLLSCGDEGAYFLTASPISRLGTLTNEAFTALARARLGMLPHDGAHADGGPCRLTGCGSKDVGTTGLHVVASCMESGAEGAIGLRSTRHRVVKTALFMALRALSIQRGKPHALTKGEPLCDDHFKRKPGCELLLNAALHNDARDERPRGDIGVRLNPIDDAQPVTVLDLVVTHPNPARSGLADAAKAKGTAAADAYDSKIKKYSSCFVIPAGAFVPIAMETGGRLHPESRAFLSDFVKQSLLGLEPGEKIADKDDIRYYNYALRTLLDSLAIALAREVAKALLHRGGRAKAAAVAPSPQAGAGPDGGPASA